MPFTAALSEHPSPAEAVGEVVGSVLDDLGAEPDLAVLFVSRSQAGAMEDMAATIKATLAPGTLIGAAASSVVGGGREVEHGPAVALWAARVGPVAPIRLWAEREQSHLRVRGLEELGQGGMRGTLLLLADPFSFPVEALVDSLTEELPDLTVVGGIASAARGPGGNRLLLGGSVHSDGAVGVLLPEGVVVAPVVSQGCRPVGEPMIVTEVDGRTLLGLAGRPALERLLRIHRGLVEEDRSVFELGAQIGVVVDERRATFGPGDFLIRNVLDTEPDRGGVVIGDQVPVGTTVQFHLRDSASADRELARLLATVEPAAHPLSLDGPGWAQGALLFTCNGRGSAFFGEPDHDAGLVVDSVGRAVAGMACAGEIGPIAGRSFLHGYTASVVVLRD